MNVNDQLDAMRTDKTICDHCYGCGKLASDDDESPWLAWAELPHPSNMAVVMGFVVPKTCHYCNGTGRRTT